MPRTRSGTAQRNPAGYRRLGSYHDVEEYELTTNGLRVLYKHDPTSLVVGLMVTYLVGSRNEALGHTGATHLLEHLMFKGSKKFPSKSGMGALDHFAKTGAKVNATTWLDRTNYYEVMPRKHINFAIELEADRMRHAVISEKDRAEEMPAVRSEYARGENDPLDALDKHVWATAYQAHPYHHSTIGWLPDIENISIERLQRFYDTFYWPNNAYVSVIGDIERTTALTLIRRYFGVHPRSPHPIPTVYTQEPEQKGRRFVEVRRAGTKHLVGVAYKVPQALHPDTPALLALSSILAGGTTSRLHQALVDTNLATSVRSMYVPLRDPSLMPFYATLAHGVSHKRVESVIQAQIRKLTTAGVTQHELARVLAALQTDMAFARDGHYAMLSVLNESIASGDWKYLFDLPAHVGGVRAADVRRVARTYLTDLAMTVGHYHATT